MCLNFYWPSLEKQIIIKGNASKISENESEDYFKSRPFGSKIGAIVSNQSEVIESREFLEKSLEKQIIYIIKSILKGQKTGVVT